MREAVVSIVNKTGLHARPVSEFLKVVNQFKCNVSLIKGDKTANARSILNILTLCLGKGSQVTIQTDGPDEDEAIKALADFISNLKE